MSTAAPSSARLLVALFGPTSSGKTRLSIELCRRLARHIEPVVVSADSRQIYRYMDIGTSKAMAAEMRGIRHEMLSVADPVRKYELESYVSLARQRIDGCWAAGQLPVIVGGTAVYVKALLEGWETDTFAQTRNSVRRDFPPAMADDAYQTLRKLDRSAADRVHPNNYDAVINALTHAMTPTRTGQNDRSGAHAPRTVVLGLDRPAHQLDARVTQTFDRQMEQGLFEEVLTLCSRYDLDEEVRRRGKHSANQVLHTHGYREFWEVARERGKPVMSLTNAELSIVRQRVIEHIQSYTRRQRDAFRKMPGLRMVRTAEKAYQAIAATATW